MFANPSSDGKDILSYFRLPSLGCQCDFIVVGSDFLDPDSSLVDSCKGSASCRLIVAHGIEAAGDLSTKNKKRKKA